jgi:hypothetical protein
MEMLLAGALVTLLVQLSKWIARKIQSEELTKAAVLLVGFLLSLAAALLYRLAPREYVEAVIQTWAVAIGFYEVAWKNVVSPAVDKIQEK